MARRMVLVTLICCFILGSLATPASARPIANTSQKGSLLIFPKVVSYGYKDEPFAGISIVDTIITIGNDNYMDVYLKCYWVDENQTVQDFQFQITGNQPIAFSAWGNRELYNPDGTGLAALPTFRNKVGQLVCWAVDAGDSTQIQFNHLYGDALIVTTFGEELSILTAPVPAWSFRALQDPSPNGGGVGGRLPLDGITYDACPKYLVANFTPSGLGFPGGIPDVTLVPCRQDLRQDRIPTCTKAKFDVWNYNERKYTGAYQCLKCWYEGYLDQMGTDPYQKGPGQGGANFTYDTLLTFAARFRVQGMYSSECVGKTRGCPGAGDAEFTDAWGGPGTTIPFVGIFHYAIPVCDDDDCRAMWGWPQTGYSLHGAGSDANGRILWDATDPVVPEHSRR